MRPRIISAVGPKPPWKPYTLDTGSKLLLAGTAAESHSEWPVRNTKVKGPTTFEATFGPGSATLFMHAD